MGCDLNAREFRGEGRRALVNDRHPALHQEHQ
jgi:hypothetical protein